MKRIVTALFLFVCLPAFGQENWNFSYQSTYIWQQKQPFRVRYTGPNSLVPSRETSYSFTATAFAGYRPWTDGELYFDPELIQGKTLSNMTGLGGFPNGELAKASGSSPVAYVARLFLRQTWNLGGKSGDVESSPNQLAGSLSSRRLVLTMGKLSIIDIFGNNAYSSDPRTAFFNGALTTYGAFDYAANSRGYTMGAALEYYRDEWAVRLGRFMQPKEPNQMALDGNLIAHYGEEVEIEHDHTLGKLPGKISLLAFRNRAKMSSYLDAIAYAATHGGVPDLNAVRTRDRVKTGLGIDLEQSVSPDLGLFARISHGDGQTETYAFTEIDSSVSGGVSLKGSNWGRQADTLGLALARNGLSAAQQAYLGLGGLGYFIGDGALSYKPETAFESYYSMNVGRGAFLSLDFQRIANPGYNADRGIVSVWGLRLHVESM